MPFLRELFLFEEFQWLDGYPHAREVWDRFKNHILIDSDPPISMMRLEPKISRDRCEGFDLTVCAPQGVEVKITAPVGDEFAFDCAILGCDSEVVFSVRVADEVMSNRLLVITRIEDPEEFIEGSEG